MSDVVVLLSSESDEDVKIVEERTAVPAAVQTRDARVDTVEGLSTKKRRANRTPVHPQSKAARHVVDLTASPPPVPATQKSPDQPRPAFQNCAICLDSITPETIASTKCGHVFCFGCIQEAQAATKRCPTCRCKLNKKDYHRLFL